jgi:hypothetical protein
MKKKKVPRAVQAQQATPKVNPFELKGSKRKFDVLGKRDKGEKKNVIKSREDAVNRVSACRAAGAAASGHTVASYCCRRLLLLLLLLLSPPAPAVTTPGTSSTQE